MKKILAAVDGSAASVQAAKKALEISDALHGDVTLIYVDPPARNPDGVPLGLATQLQDAAVARGVATLNKVLVALERPTLQTMNMRGEPADVIADTAAAERYELVVVGSRGRGAVSRVLLGSVAARLVSVCKCSLLIIR